MATSRPINPTTALAALALSWRPDRAERPLYHVVNWDHYFESADTRKLRRLTFVCVPNKHDGKGIGRVKRLKNPIEIYGAFQVMVQVASKMPARGYLCDEDGPFDAEDLALMTGFPDLAFARAFKELTGSPIEWLECVTPLELASFREILPASPGISGNLPASPETLPASPAISGNLPASKKQSVDEKGMALQRDTGRTPETPGDSPGISGNFPACPETPGKIHVEGKGMEGNGREGSPTVPERGQETGENSEAIGLTVSEAHHRLCGIFTRDPKRKLGYEAEHDLGTNSPIPEHEMAVVEWFYKLPPDESDHILSARHRSLEKLIHNWLKAVDEARGYAQKKGGAPGIDEKKRKAPPEPEGWREWCAGKGYPVPDRKSVV